MTLKDRIKNLCKLKKIPVSKLENDLEFAGGYISKLDKSSPNTDKINTIAKYLDVSLDYLIGNSDKIMCSDCEYYYNPIDKESIKLHETQHKAYKKAVEKYGFCFSSEKCQDEVYSVMNALAVPLPDYSINKMADIYIHYLKIEFSDLLRSSNYVVPYHTFDEYAKAQTLEDIHQNFMSHDLFLLLAEKYDIDTNYISGNEQLLARVSNNSQLMRILAYTEKLNPRMLDALEVQIKALAESQEKGS